MSHPFEVGVYYFPGYHSDPRYDAVHGRGWTEWELVRSARPRFAGHRQPLTPAWGHEDEADPRAMARKIDAAADHGINHFIFDWYWYDDGMFLERCLERGYLGAANCDRLKFALMWANHDWVDIHPATLGQKPALLYPGAVTRKTFDAAADYVIEKYFRHPSYWKIDGAPYFSIYELATLIGGLGGLEPAGAALADFRRKTRAAGFRDLHLNGVIWGRSILPNEQKLDNPSATLRQLGFDSISSYVWIHHIELKDFPCTDYRWTRAEAVKDWRRRLVDFDLPYHPNVTMGWDSSPRTHQAGPFQQAGYPYMPILTGNSPAEFRESLRCAKTFLEEKPHGPRVLSINAWNEWTEGSYLEPDMEHGLGYLEAIREVFGA